MNIITNWTARAETGTGKKVAITEVGQITRD